MCPLWEAEAQGFCAVGVSWPDGVLFVADSDVEGAELRRVVVDLVEPDSADSVSIVACAVSVLVSWYVALCAPASPSCVFCCVLSRAVWAGSVSALTGLLFVVAGCPSVVRGGDSVLGRRGA